jgi:succinate dehydrogenase hydrophobic anchor subunit
VVVLGDLYAQLGIFLALWPLIVYEVQDSITIAMVPILSVCVFWLILRELVQIYASTFENYLKKYGNYIDIAQIILVCLTLHTYMGIQNWPEDLIKGKSTGVLICTTAIASVQLLFVIGKLFYSISLFTYALVQVSTFSVIYEVSHPRS